VSFESYVVVIASRTGSATWLSRVLLWVGLCNRPLWSVGAQKRNRVSPVAEQVAHAVVEEVAPSGG
jgi:hypothetical protein